MELCGQPRFGGTNTFIGIIIQPYLLFLSSVQLLSHVQLFATPWTTARQASLSITNSQGLLKLMSIKSVMPSSHLILCHPLLLLPPIPPSIRVFSSESVLHIRWPKYWSFSFSISPSNECSGLISFRIDWLDLLAVQGALKSLLQHHSSKASILRRSAFLMVRLWHPHMTTGKAPALTRWTFVCKVISLLFNMLSKFVIAFLPRSKLLLISWLQSPSAVVLEPKKIKSVTVSIVSPSRFSRQSSPLVEVPQSWGTMSFPIWSWHPGIAGSHNFSSRKPLRANFNLQLCVLKLSDHSRQQRIHLNWKRALSL